MSSTGNLRDRTVYVFVVNAAVVWITELKIDKVCLTADVAPVVLATLESVVKNEWVCLGAHCKVIKSKI